jgi:ADP-ribose pyrophosphatase
MKKVDQHEHWKPQIRNRSVVYKNDFYDVCRVVADFDGFTKEYYVQDHGRRAGVVVIRERKVLIVRQYRLLVDDLSWEIPGGGIMKGETPEQAAVRECLEETGVSCKNLKPLIHFSQSLDIVYCPTDVFYTDDFFETDKNFINTKETVEHTWIPIPECIEMIRVGLIPDGFTIASILAYSTLVDENHGQGTGNQGTGY